MRRFDISESCRLCPGRRLPPSRSRANVKHKRPAGAARCFCGTMATISTIIYLSSVACARVDISAVAAAGLEAARAIASCRHDTVPSGVARVRRLPPSGARRKSILACRPVRVETVSDEESLAGRDLSLSSFPRPTGRGGPCRPVNRFIEPSNHGGGDTAAVVAALRAPNRLVCCILCGLLLHDHPEICAVPAGTAGTPAHLSSRV